MLIPAVALLSLLGVVFSYSGDSSAIPCGERRRLREPYCHDDSRCAWVTGKGCVDKDPDRYFGEHAFEGNNKEVAKKKFCRCALHLMAKGVKEPHRVCARSTKTSTGGKPCVYNFAEIPDNEVRAYVSKLEQSNQIEKGYLKLPIHKLRVVLQTWYDSKKQKISGSRK